VFFLLVNPFKAVSTGLGLCQLEPNFWGGGGGASPCSICIIHTIIIITKSNLVMRQCMCVISCSYLVWGTFGTRNFSETESVSVIRCKCQLGLVSITGPQGSYSLSVGSVGSRSVGPSSSSQLMLDADRVSEALSTLNVTRPWRTQCPYNEKAVTTDPCRVTACTFVNLLSPCVLLTQCIHVFRVILTIVSDYFPKQH
jgi:hypothetical protein